MVYKLEQNKNMKLTIPYYLHKAGAGFPSPATDYIEEDIDLNMHLIKTLVQERDKKFLTSGSKEFSDRILINEEQDIFIWGVVTYVIHSTY